MFVDFIYSLPLEAGTVAMAETVKWVGLIVAEGKGAEPPHGFTTLPKPNDCMRSTGTPATRR